MTPAKVDKMTMQQAMDYAVQQIVAQDGQCLAGHVCLYDNGKCNHCAIGWLLDHESYPELKDARLGLTAFYCSHRDKLPTLIIDHLDAFSVLQAFHDYESVDTRTRLRKTLSNKFDIDTTGPHWQQWVDMGKPNEK